MPKLFISYSRVDEPFARQLARSMSALGASIWIDVEEIPAGMKWSRAIQQGLDACDALLLVISPASMNSENVEDEWQYFLDQRKPVFPILLVPAKIHFQLSRIQYIDFHSQPYDVAFPQLHSELNRRGIELSPLAGINRQVEIPVQAPLEVSASSQLPAVRAGRGPGVIAALGLVAALLVIGVLFVSSRISDTGGNPIIPASETVDEVTGSATTDAPALTPSEQVTPLPSPTRAPALSATDIFLTDQAAVAMAETQIFLTELAPTRDMLTATAESWTHTPSPIYRSTAYARMTETHAAMEAAAAGTQTQIALVSPTPRPSLTPSQITCTDAPPSRLNVGMRAAVTISPEGAERQNLLVRQEPGGSVVGRLSEGTLLYITDEGTCTNGLLWWPIETIDGALRGWSAEGQIGAVPNEYFMVPASN